MPVGGKGEGEGEGAVSRRLQVAAVRVGGMASSLQSDGWGRGGRGGRGVGLRRAELSTEVSHASSPSKGK